MPRGRKSNNAKKQRSSSPQSSSGRSSSTRRSARLAPSSQELPVSGDDISSDVCSSQDDSSVLTTDASPSAGRRGRKRADRSGSSHQMMEEIDSKRRRRVENEDSAQQEDTPQDTESNRKRRRTDKKENSISSSPEGKQRRKAPASRDSSVSSNPSSTNRNTLENLNGDESPLLERCSQVPERPGKVLLNCRASPGSPRKTNGSLQKCVNNGESAVVVETPQDVWENWNDGTEGKDPLVDRVWRGKGISTAATNSSNTSLSEFVVVSYNILSEFHLNTEIAKSKLRPEDWHRTQRHKLLLREVDFLDPDVLCLQEVDTPYYQSLLTKDMTKRGYTGHLTPRCDNPVEGVATFYRLSRFKEIAIKSFPLKQIAEAILVDSSLSSDIKQTIVEYMENSNELQTVLLTCRSTGRVLCVGNLLTASSSSGVKQDLDCVQVAGALWTINDLIQHLSSANGCNSSRETSRSRDWILCGNLGGTPDSPAYQLCRDGYPSDSSLKLLQRVQTVDIPGQSGRQALVNLFWRAFQHPFSDIISCYQSVLGREPPMTTNLGNQRGCLDYLWCSQAGLTPSAVLLPRSTYLRQNRDRLPNAKLPSHHTSLACRLTFK